MNKETSQSETTIHTKFKKLFETNHTIKITEVKIQIKPGCYPIQEKERPIPYHLQDDVKNELDRLIKSRHLERLETIEEDCSVSSVVITVKKDKTVKIAPDARKLNGNCIKKKPHMPNMDELINQISSELSTNELNPIWISVIDLDYAYGQMRLAPETSKHCNFAITGEKMNGYYRLLKGFYGPADIPTLFQEKIDRTTLLLKDNRSCNYNMQLPQKGTTTARKRRKQLRLVKEKGTTKESKRTIHQLRKISWKTNGTGPEHGV